MSSQQLFAEIFPIRTDILPPLSAYRVTISAGASTRRVGTKLAAWMADVFGGFWVYSGGRLITDAPPNPIKLVMAVDAARAEQRRDFQVVETVVEDFQWQPTPDEIGDYVIRGPVALLEGAILDALAQTVYSIRSTRIEREYRLRTWSVDNCPALSVSVISRLLYEPDLQCYLETMEKPSETVGLWVTDKFSRLQGEVVKLVGKLDEHRERLLELARRDTTRQLIADAPGDHYVVRVLSGTREYDYVADALDLVIRIEDIDQFAINRQQVEKALHLKPALHAQMVKLVSDILKDANLIGAAFSTQNAPHLFKNDAPKPNLTFANRRVRPYHAEKLAYDFTESGAYCLPERLSREPLRVVVVNTLNDSVKDFLEALQRTLQRDFNLSLDVVRERNMRVITPANLESAVRLLQKEQSDLVLVFLPDEIDSDEDEGISDRYTRAQTIGRGLPCLIVHESTLHEPESMSRVVMGLLARAGAIPYLLADPLPYADRIVGLSFIEQSKREGDFLTGIARIYAGDGTPLRGIVTGALAQDGIPAALLARLFPRDLLAEKRVVLHYEGRLRGEMLRAIGGLEDDLDAVFYPVEVIRAGVPRVYALNAGKIEPPQWGSVLRLSPTEAFIQSSGATPQPLHIRSEPPLSVEEAAQSVLMFTLFHYGATKPLKTPVTIHNTDAIENGIVRGVMPTEIETPIVFWL